MYSEDIVVTEEKLVKLAIKLQQHYRIDEEEALEIIYEEWDLIEEAFSYNLKLEEVYTSLINTLNDIYRVA
jgi:hypothetical protein